MPELGVAGVGGERGVLKAPVLCFCSASKSSCSSLGRRGGEGPLPKGGAELRCEAEVLRGAAAVGALREAGVCCAMRRERWRGRRVRARCIVGAGRWCCRDGMGVVVKGWFKEREMLEFFAWVGNAAR